jgi:uncharacterized UPF0160 family protein
MDTPTLLITHDGQFHADELFTIALTHWVFGPVPYKRTRKVTQAELDDPSIWVLDQYGQMDVVKHNFDHHQDKSLQATNVLVMHFLYMHELISKDLYEILQRSFIAISDYDRNGPVSFNGFQVNEFFKTFNNLENGFELALDVVKTWLQGLNNLLAKKEEAERIYKDGRSIGTLVKVCRAFPILWHTMGPARILVAPEKDTWRVHSADTSNYPIVSTGKELFLHENKFIAAYKTKEDAVVAATLTARIEPLYPLL